jgi:hypothetical protein
MTAGFRQADRHLLNPETELDASKQQIHPNRSAP